MYMPSVVLQKWHTHYKNVGWNSSFSVVLYSILHCNRGSPSLPRIPQCCTIPNTFLVLSCHQEWNAEILASLSGSGPLVLAGGGRVEPQTQETWGCSVYLQAPLPWLGGEGCGRSGTAGWSPYLAGEHTAACLCDDFLACQWGGGTQQKGIMFVYICETLQKCSTKVP